VKDQMQEYIKY